MNFREFRHRLFGIFLVPLALYGPFSFLRVWANKLRGVTVGKGVWIGYDAFIDQPPDVKESMVEIQDGVGVGFRNAIFAHDSSPKWRGEPVIFKKVVLEKNVYLGANVTIMPGVRLGEGAVIGAGSVVIRDVPPHHIAVGVPAKAIKRLEQREDGKWETVDIDREKK